MIVPRNRLIFWFAVAGLPFSVLAGTHPAGLAVCAVAMTGLIVLATVDALRSRRLFEGIAVEVPPVTRLAHEKDGQIELRIRNPSGQRRELRLALGLPTEITTPWDELHVALPGESEWSKIRWDCHPEKRGCYTLEAAYLEATSPLGLWSARTRRPLQAEIRVYPNMQKDRMGLGLMFRGTLGTHTQRQVGKGREFEKLRDYVPGDGSEDIHWKATARRGKPVTKVFQIERTQEVYVAIDTSRLSAREDAIERHISTALLIGMAAEQQGDLFGLLTFSNRVKNFVRARNGTAHYHTCRDTIYAQQPEEVNPDFDEVCSFIRLRLRRRALVIFLTALDDPLLAENFVKNIDLIAHQHLIVVGMMQPAGVQPLFTTDAVADTDALYDQLGGHMRWHELEETGKQLQRRGVKLAVFDGERMGLRLVSEYLNIKKRQVL